MTGADSGAWRPRAGGDAAGAAHKDPRRQRDCAGPLSYRQLGREFLTDVLELRLDVPLFGEQAARNALRPARREDRLDEMDGTSSDMRPTHRVALVLVDDIPGGAGHRPSCRRKLRAVFEAARRNAALDVLDAELGVTEPAEETSPGMIIPNVISRPKHGND